MGGTYREVVPPERFVSAESWGPEWPETINTTVLTESDGRTTITLTIAYPSKEARDAALRTGMKDGMDAGFARTDRLHSMMQSFIDTQGGINRDLKPTEDLLPL